MRWFAFVLSLAMVAAQAAESECVEWRVFGWGGTEAMQAHTDVNAAFAAAIAAENAYQVGGGGGGSYYLIYEAVGSCTPAGPVTMSCGYRSQQQDRPGGSDMCEVNPGSCGVWGSTGYWNVTAYEVDPEECEDSCSINEGKDAFIGMKADVGEHCVGGCVVSVTLPKSIVRCSITGACSYASLSQGTYTGASCIDESDATAGNCLSGSFGRMCIKESPSGEDNCGIFNGDRVCVDAIQSGCQSFASGGMACVVEGDGATTELPDDGDSSPAEPQMQVEKDGKVVNYYNSTTVANSSVAVVGNQASGGNGGVGSGSGELGDGIEECDGEADCYGTLPDEVTGCSGDSLTDCVAGYAATAWGIVTEGVPILGVAAGLHSSFSTAGTCPEVPVTIFEETHDAMAPVCSILGTHGGLFQLIMQICWSILGVRILLRPEGEGS